MTIYRCKHCGNIIAHLNDSGVRCVCCGEPMEAADWAGAGTDASKEALPADMVVDYVRVYSRKP